MKTSVLVKVLAPSLAVCWVLGLSGCATTRQVKNDKQSGFLGDYSMLRKGGKGEAGYLYINTNAQWANYSKVWLKSIELWKADDPKSHLSKASPEAQQMLVDSFHTAMHQALTNSFELVDHGGPGVLVIRGALTDGRPSKPAINLLSSVYPPLKLVSTADRLITGTDLGVGAAFVEAEFTDGQTEQRVAAVMDARAGTKALRTKADSRWGDIQRAYDWWAQRTQKRLMLFKQGDFSTAKL